MEKEDFEGEDGADIEGDYEEDDELVDDDEGDLEEDGEAPNNAEDNGNDDEFEGEERDEDNESSSSENLPSDAETEALLKQVLQAKMRLAILKRKRRILLEELHRQCLEGELDPKKRLKPFLDKCKKNKVHVALPSASTA